MNLNFILYLFLLIMANQSSNKWIGIMEKRKDTSTIGPITSTASEISLRFDRQSERTRSNSDSTDNEEIVPITSSPQVDDGSNGDKVSLKEGGAEGRRTEEISDKEESTEERRNEKKRLNRNEDSLQEREEKSPKKLKTEQVREKEEASEVQNETNHYDSDSDSDATDIALTVMDYTDDFYKGKDNMSTKANSMWCSPEVVPPAGNEIRESGSEVNDDGSSDPSNEEMSQPVANSTNNIADRTNYIDNTSYPEGPRGPSIMINIGLEYCVLNREASHVDDACAHVVPFGDSSLLVSTDVSSEEGEIGGFPLLGLTNAIELPVSDVSVDPNRSDCVCSSYKSKLSV